MGCYEAATETGGGVLLLVIPATTKRGMGSFYGVSLCVLEGYSGLRGREGVLFILDTEVCMNE